MAVFSDRMSNDLAEAAAGAFRAYALKLSLKLSHDEVVAAFIEHDHIEKLKEVSRMVGASGVATFPTKIFTSEMELLSDCTVHFTSNMPILIPEYVQLGLASTCPDELREKISKWADTRYDLGIAGGDLVDAIHHLNWMCGDVRTMKALLPCLPGIMARINSDQDSKTMKKARAMLNTTGCGAIPPLSRAVKQRLLEISALANAIFMTEEPASAEKNDGKTAVLIKNNYTYGAPALQRPWLFKSEEHPRVYGSFI